VLQRYTLGRYPVLGLADARRKALDLLRQLAESGGEPVPEPVLLSQLVEQYVELHLKPSVRTWQNVQSSLKQPAMQALHGRPAEKVTPADVVAVLDAITAAGKPHGAVNLLKGLKAMYNWAMDRGAVAANPCQKIRPPVKTTQRERILRNDEIAAVLGACDKVRPPFGDMVRMLLYTGARRNEVSEMRWSELSGNVWTLPAERSKSSRVNVLPLPLAAMELLGELPRQCGDACPRTHEHYVGQAAGEDGFLGRWREYVATGHGGNVGLRGREASDYQVSVLEVVGTNDLTRIGEVEALWKRKLLSRDIGLNLN
jgi:hypothetical protein